MTDIEKAPVGRYRIERELGRGGMGAVYLARDLKLDRSVALKVLPPEFGTNAALRERFLRETRTAASFSHPNIVPVHAVEEHDGVLAFAMGFVEGESVAERVKRQGPLDSRAVARMLTDVAYALAYAHGRGVVHRDIKPDNIMIERAPAARSSWTLASRGRSAHQPTRRGLVLLVRSPFRMSPGERLFRIVWLGGFGRWFLRRASKGLTPGVTASTGTTGPRSPVPAIPVARTANGTTMADLDKRTRALEEWRYSEHTKTH